VATLTSIDTSEILIHKLHDALAQTVQAIAEEELKAATTRMEERVRQEVAAIAIRVMQWAEIQHMGNRIVIEVKTDDLTRR
jgi:hypothetical protein